MLALALLVVKLRETGAATSKFADVEQNSACVERHVLKADVFSEFAANA